MAPSRSPHPESEPGRDDETPPPAPRPKSETGLRSGTGAGSSHSGLSWPPESVTVTRGVASSCPPVEILEAYLAGDLDTSATLMVEDHVDRCVGCEQELRRITDRGAGVAAKAATVASRSNPGPPPAPTGHEDTAIPLGSRVAPPTRRPPPGPPRIPLPVPPAAPRLDTRPGRRGSSAENPRLGPGEIPAARGRLDEERLVRRLKEQGPPLREPIRPARGNGKRLTPVPGLDLPGTSAGPGPPSDLQPRVHVFRDPDGRGGYEILDIVGRGGMGVVYKARDVSLGRVVALKVINPRAGGDAADPRRLRREAKAVARLEHPNIVRVHHVGESEGRPHLAMEFVDGEPLARVLRSRRFRVPEVLRIGRALADAVAHAHARGVVHRDLKPANVLIGPGDVPKIVDFGLAALELDPTTCLTNPDMMIGTPSYMAPEQARPDLGEVGPPADVFGLGCLLYETLVGHPPFVADTLEELILKVRACRPRPVATHRADVPAPVAELVERCLNLRPDERPDAATLVRELDRLRRVLDPGDDDRTEHDDDPLPALLEPDDEPEPEPDEDSNPSPGPNPDTAAETETETDTDLAAVRPPARPRAGVAPILAAFAAGAAAGYLLAVLTRG